MSSHFKLYRTVLVVWAAIVALSVIIGFVVRGDTSFTFLLIWSLISLSMVVSVMRRQAGDVALPLIGLHIVLGIAGFFGVGWLT